MQRVRVEEDFQAFNVVLTPSTENNYFVSHVGGHSLNKLESKWNQNFQGCTSAVVAGSRSSQAQDHTAAATTAVLEMFGKVGLNDLSATRIVII